MQRSSGNFAEFTPPALNDVRPGVKPARSSGLLLSPGVYLEMDAAKQFGLVTAVLFGEFSRLASYSRKCYGSEFADASVLYGMLPEFTPEAVAEAAKVWADRNRWVVAWKGITPLIQLSDDDERSPARRRGPVAGWVYVLTNPSIPNMVKIGVTSGDPKDRAKALSGGTAIPTPFEVAHSIYHADSYGVERQVHELLREDRTPGREFFRVGLAQAVKSIQSVVSAMTGE